MQQNSGTATVDGHKINPALPLHKFVADRMRNERDVFIVITAKNSARGVGKTTLALYLCIGWTRWFTSHDWWCDDEQPSRGMATVEPKEFFEIVDRVGEDYQPGTAIFLDEAEELTGRRAMDDKNVEFIQRMQMMRKKQAISILALPDPGALDPGIERLADVWINVTRRGAADIHKMGVHSYGNRDITTKRVHQMEFPDVSDHAQMTKLDQMKDTKMSEWAKDEEDEEEEQGMTKREQAMYAKMLKEKRGVGWNAVADLDDELTYVGETLRREWRSLERESGWEQSANQMEAGA
jgi:hypothetical protein